MVTVKLGELASDHELLELSLPGGAHTDLQRAAIEGLPQGSHRISYRTGKVKDGGSILE